MIVVTLLIFGISENFSKLSLGHLYIDNRLCPVFVKQSFKVSIGDSVFEGFDEDDTDDELFVEHFHISTLLVTL